MGAPVDHHGARSADALAAVVVEGDGFLAVGDEPLVEHIEQLEERHVGAYVVDVVLLEATAVVRAGLAPHAEMNLHLELRCASSTASKPSSSRCIVGFSPTPVNSHAATYAKSSSSRSASPSSVWCSTRKWPPQLSSRCSASRHMSSANSRQSETRPAFSSDWLNVSFSPSTRTSAWNSARSGGISPSAFFRLSALRSMPQFSHSTLPSSRWNQSTDRLPFTASSACTRSSTSRSTAANTGSPVGTGGSPRRPAR